MTGLGGYGYPSSIHNSIATLARYKKPLSNFAEFQVGPQGNIPCLNVIQRISYPCFFS